MKKSQFLLAGIALLSMGLASCSSDEPADGGGDVSTKDQTLYMKIALMDVNSASRAADPEFDKGTDAENKIGILQFKFYDASGKQIFQKTVDTPKFETENLEGNVGKVSTTTIQVDVSQGQNMPAYVVCFANPVIWTGEETENPASTISQMQGLRNLTRHGYKNADNNFAMNNSVYFGTDPISGSQNVKMVGAPIQKGQLFTSKDAAEKATGDKIVDIYIERYAAKVKVTIAENAIASTTVDGYTLTFKPEYVGLTADAADMYVIKRFSIKNEENDPIPSESEVQTALGTWTLWNDAGRHRSYWACSPSYYATAFPLVSDNIIDQVATGTGAGELVGNYKLKYYSYDQMKANATGDISNAISAGSPVTLYTLENTMGKDAFSSRNPKAAAPSVLLLGTTTLSGSSDITPGTTFYVWNSKIYFGATVPAGAAEGAKSILDAMLATQEVLASDAQGARVTVDDLDKSVLSVIHPAKVTREATGVPLAEDLVTLQVSTVGESELYYRPLGSSSWVVLPSTNNTDALNYVNRQLGGQLNYAHAYTNGKCYYTIPIKHLGFTENTAAQPVDAQGEIDWTKVRVGDFGLVRNHVYDIKITNINGYGSGILNLANPIVTPMETNSYWIKYNLNVLNWRIVPPQEVVLP